MKLVTRFELAVKNKNELHGLLSQAFNDLREVSLMTHSVETHWLRFRIFKMNWIQWCLALEKGRSYSLSISEPILV